MNVNNIHSECKVISKYFTGNNVMDESLTDFKEKKSFHGPKNVKAVPKPRAKKAVKKIKGQKDIRTALKPKKCELIAFSKDFDNACKKSGIDVDSEQLQLAIALSKSLQTDESADTSSTSQPLSPQQRTGLIRTTLKEYGFKVPEVKASVNRKTKKRRKPYKLLLTTDEQKEQIISDRYTQLLFELNNSRTTSTNTYLDPSGVLLYNMATNINYTDMKDDNVFYVDDLIEKSPNNMGSLLKDWSNIPGRPSSPTQNKSDITFSEIECSQDEVDIVLSGSLKFSKDILKKYLHKRKSVACTIDEVIDETDEEISPVVLVCGDKILSPKLVTASSDFTNKTVTKDIEIKEQKKELLTVTQPCRSLSPDLFDDDDDETVVEIAEESPVKAVCNIAKETSTVMDLTECVNDIPPGSINSYFRNKKQISQLSQDVTKRKSNDFMEITECVGVTSQPIVEAIEELIDLTMPCITNKVVENNDECVQNIDNVEHMDLTQSSNSSNESLPFVHISGKEGLPEKSLDDTIILNDNDYKEVNTLKISNSSTDELNDNDGLGSVTTEFKTGCDEDIKINKSVKLTQELPEEVSIINLDETSEVDKVEDNIDLTQTSKSNESDIGSPHKHTTECIYSSNTCGVNKAENAFDLPQTSKLNESDIESSTKVLTSCINNSSLGKKDDVSVDYDEALENMNYHIDYAYDSNFNNDINTEIDYNVDTLNQEVTVGNSKNAEVLELDDSKSKSPEKDAGHNFDIGGLSVINGLQSFNRESRSTLNMHCGSVMSESLPMVDIKGKEPQSTPKSLEEILDPNLDNINDRNVINNEPSNTTKTPSKVANVKIAVTPERSEYIVKTDNVTPMVDYEAMTSPERNKELDKYGLKPFKRKRAIQLLTHLYNQTHPFVESTQELTSPSKRRKLSLSQPSTSKSPRKLLNSPKKVSKQSNTSKSPRKGLDDSGNLNGVDKENYMFMVTSEVPALRDIDCGPDDWVFQKREKAKLHTCRVPLHIAFHNFVSCRKLLQEAILRYEPVNIDVIHKELVATGHRYDPKDLLKFMDKKCITVKTVDNAKNKNHY